MRLFQPKTTFLLNKNPKNQTIVAVATLAGQGSKPAIPFKNQTPAAFNPIPMSMPNTYLALKTFPSFLFECLKTQERCSKKATTEPMALPTTVASTGEHPKYVSAT